MDVSGVNDEHVHISFFYSRLMYKTHPEPALSETVLLQ